MFRPLGRWNEPSFNDKVALVAKNYFGVVNLLHADGCRSRRIQQAEYDDEWLSISGGRKCWVCIWHGQALVR